MIYYVTATRFVLLGSSRRLVTFKEPIKKYVFCNSFHRSLRTLPVCASKIVRKANDNKLSFARISSYLVIRNYSHNVIPPSKNQKNNRHEELSDDVAMRSLGLYCVSLVIFMIGVSYAAVPLYKIFCQQYGLGGMGSEAIGHNTEKIPTMKPMRDRPIRVVFAADVNSKLRWNFKPAQHSVTVVPGETALAFFTAKNPTNEAITGVATYNILPYEAALYFNKIQCFCFEEQRLNPGEEVDMPVFFYIDPEFDMDPDLLCCKEIILSYQFFEAKPGLEIPLPGFMSPSFQPKVRPQ